MGLGRAAARLTSGERVLTRVPVGVVRRGASNRCRPRRQAQPTPRRRNRGGARPIVAPDRVSARGCGRADTHSRRRGVATGVARGQLWHQIAYLPRVVAAPTRTADAAASKRSGEAQRRSAAANRAEQDRRTEGGHPRKNRQQTGVNRGATPPATDDRVPGLQHPGPRFTNPIGPASQAPTAGSSYRCADGAMRTSGFSAGCSWRRPRRCSGAGRRFRPADGRAAAPAYHLLATGSASWTE